MRAQTRPQSPGLDDIRAILAAHLPQLRQQYSIKALGIFGSYARGEQRKRSDVDLLIEFEEAPSFFEFVRLERRLSELVGIKVDLVMKSALRPSIRETVLQEVVPIEA